MLTNKQTQKKTNRIKLIEDLKFLETLNLKSTANLELIFKCNIFYSELRKKLNLCFKYKI